jgi:hypothetical protein
MRSGPERVDRPGSKPSSRPRDFGLSGSGVTALRAASPRAADDGGVRQQAALAVTASAVSVVAVSVVIGLLHGVVPVLSLGVLYLFAVLPIAATFGLGYAIAVSVASMVAFNFFFLKPIHTLTLADSGNWLALATFVCTSLVVSELAGRIRRRATEAEQRARARASQARRRSAGSPSAGSPPQDGGSGRGAPSRSVADRDCGGDEASASEQARDASERASPAPRSTERGASARAVEQAPRRTPDLAAASPCRDGRSQPHDGGQGAQLRSTPSRRRANRRSVAQNAR